MKDCFSFYDDEEISDSVYDYIFSLCDCFSCVVIFPDTNKTDMLLKESIYGDLKSNVIERHYGKDKWCTSGIIYTFKLSDEIKLAIKKSGLEGKICIDADEKIFLENFSLYNLNKIMFSACSHEGYFDIDEGFKTKIKQKVEERIIKTNTYKRMQKVYYNLKKEYSDKEIEIIYQKLSDIEPYIAKDCNAIIRGNAVYDNVCWEEYYALAKKVFSNKILDRMQVNSFKELCPSGYKINFDLSAKNYFQFYSTQLYYDMKRELSFIYLFIN